MQKHNMIYAYTFLHVCLHINNAGNLNQQSAAECRQFVQITSNSVQNLFQ